MPIRDKRTQERLARIKHLADEMESLTDDELRERTKLLRASVSEDEKKRQSG